MRDSDANDAPDGEKAHPWWERESLRLLQPGVLRTRGGVPRALTRSRSQPPTIETNLSPTVGVGLDSLPDGYLLQLLNRGGIAGASIHEPPAIRDTTVRIRGAEG